MTITPIRSLLLILSLSIASPVLADEEKQSGSMLPADLLAVSPMLQDYSERFLVNGLWKDASLSPRDRSLVTVAALVATTQTGSMSDQIATALDNGVTPAELSELVGHLSLYTGLANGNAAAIEMRKVFAARNIGIDQMAPAKQEMLPLNEAAEAKRVARVAESLGPVFQNLQDFTTDVLFKDLWLRPALAPRDRSLITVSALVSTGRTAQLTGHINLGMDNGLTDSEVAGTIVHLAFYSGWPNAMSAVSVANDVFAKRSG